MAEKPKKDRGVKNEPSGSTATRDGQEPPRSYYYDDACGYETYRPETDLDDPDEDEESAVPNSPAQ